MSYSKINKNIAKTLTGFCLLFVLSLTTVFGAQTSAVKDYRQIRPQKNPQEFINEYQLADGGREKMQLTFAKYLGALTKDQEGKINPTYQMTNLDTVRALANVYEPELQAQYLTDDDYKDKALDYEFITDEYLERNQNFFERVTTQKEYGNFFYKLYGKKIIYTKGPEEPLTRGDFAQGLFDHKELIMAQRGEVVMEGEVLSKGRITESNINKDVTTVKLNRVYNIPVTDFERQNPVQGVDYNADVSFLNIVSNNDLILLTPQGFTTNINNLAQGTILNIYYKDGEIVYVEQFMPPRTNHTGILRAWSITPRTDNNPAGEETVENEDNTEPKNYNSTIEIIGYDGIVQKYTVHPNVNIHQVNGELGSGGVAKPINEEMLSFGQEVYLETTNNLVTLIKAYVPVEEELNAYIPPMSRLVSGVVLDKGDDYITLTDNSTYQIGPDTFIMKNSAMTDQRAIKDGDNIKLYFDSISSPLASKVEIEGSQRQAGDIIKGKVGTYSVAKKGLTIKDVKRLQGGTWVKAEQMEGDRLLNPEKYPQRPTDMYGNNFNNKSDIKDYQNFRIKGDVYASSKKISPNMIKNFMNQDIYAVLSPNQGIPTIAKAKIRPSNGLSYKDNIQNIDHAQNTIQIDNNLLTFDDSTIVIKDGNLVSASNIEKGIYTNVETNMQKQAQIVVQEGSVYNVEKKDSFPYKIYRGTVRDFFEDSVLLGNDIEKGRKVNHYFMMQGGVWNRLSETSTTPRLRFTDDTFVYDFENEKVITREELKDQQYKFNAFGTRPDYFNRQVYAVTKDDVLVALIFLDKEGYIEVNSQNMITAKAVGQMSGDQYEDTTIKPLLVRNISTYNSMKNILEPIAPIATTDPDTQMLVQRPVRKLINIENAVVVDNDRAIPKTSINQLRDRFVTVLYKQDRSKGVNKQGDMETLDAVVVIAH